MTKLVAFGDSCTYGFGLEDCWDSINQTFGPTCSKESWPFALAKALGIHNVDNASIPGIGPKKVFCEVMSYEYNGNETVFITWPNATRKDILINEEEYFTIRVGKAGNGTIDKRAKMYLKHFQFDYNDYFDQVSYIRMTSDYLKQQGISSYHFFTTGHDHWAIHNFKLDKHISKTQYSDICINSIAHEDKSYALDISHPGKIAHQKYARKISRWIKTLN